jgi:hypothetical protein
VVHPPGGHDAELIRRAMLCNASCEGAWNASKDDLSTALPLPSSKSGVGEGSFGFLCQEVDGFV